MSSSASNNDKIAAVASKPEESSPAAADGIMASTDAAAAAPPSLVVPAEAAYSSQRMMSLLAPSPVSENPLVPPSSDTAAAPTNNTTITTTRTSDPTGNRPDPLSMSAEASATTLSAPAEAAAAAPENNKDVDEVAVAGASGATTTTTATGNNTTASPPPAAAAVFDTSSLITTGIPKPIGLKKKKRKSAAESDENMITHYSLNKYDVLCGRGNGINNRLGNVEFRNYVDALRPSYAAAERQAKVEIAHRVVELVHKNGGKFVKFKFGPSQEVYAEIGKERAVEKACQALREGGPEKKGKPPKFRRRSHQQGGGGSSIQRKSSTGSRSLPMNSGSAGQFDDPNERDDDASLYGDSMDSYDSLQGDDYESSVDDNKNDDDNSSSRPNNVAAAYYKHRLPSTASSNKEQRSKSSLLRHPSSRGKPTQPSRRSLPTKLSKRPSTSTTEPSSSVWLCDILMDNSGDGNRIPSSHVGGGKMGYAQKFETMFRALKRFKDINGHCAIPPSLGMPGPETTNEEKDAARLSDWASLQRQLYRETTSARREATEEEKLQFMRLEAQGFIWNYEDWHWNHSYDELMKFQQEQKQQVEQQSVTADLAKCLRLAQWVKEQRESFIQGLQGKINPMKEERVQKLAKIDFSWAMEECFKYMESELNSSEA